LCISFEPEFRAGLSSRLILKVTYRIPRVQGRSRIMRKGLDINFEPEFRAGPSSSLILTLHSFDKGRSRLKSNTKGNL